VRVGRHTAAPRACVSSAAVAVSIAAAAYGAFDELTQPLFGRSASWGDWLADMVGAAVAVIVFEAVLSMRARRKPSAAPGPKES